MQVLSLRAPASCMLEGEELDDFSGENFFEPAARQSRAVMPSSVSLTTEQVYQYDWSRFSKWCIENEEQELPAHPKALSRFLQSEKAAGSGMATLNRRIAAISYMHRNNDLPSPLSHEDAALIRAIVAPPKAATRRRLVKKPAIQTWQEIVAAIGDEKPEDLRDRALLSLHVSGAFRLVELARLAFGQVRFDRSSAQIHLGRFRSHTARGSSAITLMDDQHLSPVSHLRCWMDACPLHTGSLFRHTADHRITDQPLSEAEIAAIITDRAKALGYAVKKPDGGGLFKIRPAMA